jgi:hypothetical protein
MGERRPYGTTDRCGAVPPAPYRRTANCLRKAGHEGPHRNGIDEIEWSDES